MIGLATLALMSAVTNPFSDIHMPSVHLPSFHHPADAQTTHYGVKGWRLDVRKDSFSRSTTCVIHRDEVSAAHGVVTFRFHEWTDTANAEFRVDALAPQRIGAVDVEVAGLGAPLRGKDATNPSGGKVSLPLRLVEGAHVVAIRPNVHSNHRDFPLDGFGAAIAAARGQGCDLGPPASAAT
jgi:hypothetical protein